MVSIFASKWTTTWHHGMRDTSLNTHLKLFDSSIAVKDEQPSLVTGIWHIAAPCALHNGKGLQ